MVAAEVATTAYTTEYYAWIVFVGFLYICANPFIYATKFDPVSLYLIYFFC